MRWRRALGNLIVLLATVLLIVLSGEIILRWMEGRSDDTPLRTASEDPFVPRLIPGTVAVRSGVEIRINDLGLRDDPVAVQKPEGELRILCVGDSYTFGTGVRQEATIPARLEDDLRSELGTDRINVINLGIDGANAYDNAIRIEEIGLPLDPDVVILFYLFNDVWKMERGVEWHASRRFNPEAARAAHTRERRRSYVIRFLAPRVGGLMRTLLGKKTGKLAIWDVQYRDDVPAWNVTREMLVRSRDACAARGAVFVIALLPAFATFTDDAYPLSLYRATMTAFCRDTAIPMVDLHDPFWGHSGRRYWINPLDPHPDEKADAIMAGYLSERLAELGIVAEPERAGGPTGR